MHRWLESLKEYVLLYNPPFALPFGNYKPHFIINIAFITFMVKIYYIYGEPDYYTYG